MNGWMHIMFLGQEGTPSSDSPPKHVTTELLTWLKSNQRRH